MDKALKATEFPCNCVHLYKRVRVARKSVEEATNERTLEVLAEVAMTDADTKMSSLTISPGKCMFKWEQEYSNQRGLQQATMHQIEDRIVFSTQSMKTHNAVKDVMKLYFGIGIIIKIINVIKIMTTLTNHNSNIQPPILHETMQN